MEWFEKYLEENKETIKIVFFVILCLGCLAIVYSIIAGIWGFAPSKNVNWKIFGTGFVTGLLSSIGLAGMEDV